MDLDQMQEEVRQYLRVNGEIIEPAHVRKVNKKGTCWWIKKPEWALVPNHFQTVTLLGNDIILNVWHEYADIDDFSLKELLPKEVTLAALRLRLEDMASKASRQYIENLVNDNFWEDDTEENLEMILPEERNSVNSEFSQFHKDLEQLRSLISSRADIKDLINLHNKIDSFNSKLTQMRLSR